MAITQVSENGTLWYFAYGSNMKSSVMASRGINPIATKIVKVPGYILTFDVFGLPYSEPAMASISKLAVDRTQTAATSASMPPTVHGVSYLLTLPDFRRLVGSEGGGVAYDEIMVDAVSLSQGEPESFHARTLVAKYPWRPNAAPSERYSGLLQDGAAERKLPQAYQGYLKSLPCYKQDPATMAMIGSASFLWVGRRAVRFLATNVKASLDEHGNCPPWWSIVIYVVYSAMWFWHDYAHCRVFGRGDGGKLSYGAARLL